MTWVLDYDELDEAATLTSSEVVIRIYIPVAAARSLAAIDEADWETRRSVQAGTALGQPVFWCLGEQPGTAQVLVGPDDETWDVALTSRSRWSVNWLHNVGTTRSRCRYRTCPS